MNKNRKNLLKRLRKKTNKKMRKNKSLRVETGISNIKSIPDNCKHLFQDGDVLYVVPVDGCCGPNCAAAFLFGDEVFGPQLRVLMNKFMAKHWYSRYQYITQCSQKHPFTRKLGNGEIKYTDPEKLIDFLSNSKKQLLCGQTPRT